MITITVLLIILYSGSFKLWSKYDDTDRFTIWASLISQWWFNFRLKPIYDTAPTASKNTAQFKRGQNWLKNNHLALLI